MPFEKNNKYGKQNKGVKKQKTREWEACGAYVITQGAERYVEELKKSGGREFMERFEKILEYFKPKLGRTEHTGKDGGPLEVKTVDYAEASDVPAPPVSIENYVSH